MALSEYQKRRNFAKTPEPRGGRSAKKRKKAPQGAPLLRFCVQKHQASHLHYDFRLELDGVLKSWAVPKGPSLNPQDKRLAMRVEDHPVDYLDFEGRIPEGQYGAGQVMVWDIGLYGSTETADPELSRKKIKHGLYAGEIKFVLAGKKLKGAFVLVRLKHPKDAKGDPWLLVKEKDPYAKTIDITKNKTSAISRKRL